jgi:nitric oxide reductase NorE protein
MTLETPTGAAPAAPVVATDAPTPRRIPGEGGTWVFIFGDLVMFTAFLGVFFVNRGLHSAQFEQSQAKLDVDLGAINTVFLLISSLFVVLALRAVRERRIDLAPRLYAGAIAFGVLFLLVKAYEYHAKIDADLVPTTNDFFLYYYLLTGLHAFHVMVGLIVLTVLLVLSRRKELTVGQYIFLEGGSCFWHMVDLLWIFLFPLIFLVH